MAYDREMAYDRGAERSLSRTSERTAFIQRTYAHLAGAILAFVALEAVLVNVVPFEVIIRIFGNGPFGLLLVLGAFMGASWLAQMWARSETSITMQYMGLGLYVVAEALICLPLLMIAQYLLKEKGTYIIAEAGILTLMVFGGLTAAVFMTGKDYSPLRPILAVASMIALGVIVCAILFGFSLGLFFSFAMVALMAGFILYQTSQVMLHWQTNMHVAAALMLFSSIATLFYYILRILILISGRD